MSLDTTTIHRGTCKFYGTKGAWGFLTETSTGKDIFVHASAVSKARLRELNPGDHVEFTIENDERSGRPCAANLKLI